MGLEVFAHSCRQCYIVTARPSPSRQRNTELDAVCRDLISSCILGILCFFYGSYFVTSQVLRFGHLSKAEAVLDTVLRFFASVEKEVVCFVLLFICMLKYSS